MSDYVAVNRANWDSRVLHHLAAYGLELFADDPEHLSGVVRFDRPRLGSVEGLDVVHLLESPFGAAWLRTHAGAEFGPGYVGEPVAQLAIAVVPTHRGRGWGRRLLERLLEEADKNGLSEVQLTVGLANVPAVRLYESTGSLRSARRPQRTNEAGTA